MVKAKLIGVAIAILVIVVVVLQNTEPVETTILFARIVMPRAVLLFVTTAAGFGLGALVAVMIMRRHDK